MLTQHHSPIAVYGQTRMPGAWLRVMAGIAVSAAATGPVFMAVVTLCKVLWPPDSTSTLSNYADDPITLVSDVALLSLAGSPLWLLNATAVALLVRWRRDAMGWSVAPGILAGCLLGIALTWLEMIDYGDGPYRDLGEVGLAEVGLATRVVTPCVATMALLAALYWRIAIRPRRRWRLRMESGEDAIRAME